MGRKAIQGYPEKSLYDNSRYLGMLTTSDALSEGVFRLLINFDISDTGQSVTPRQGFLTTGLKDFSVSDRSIVFQDDDSNKYVVFDFMNETGYLIDLSFYNLENKLILVEKVLTNVSGLPEGLTDYTNLSYIHDEFGVRHALFRAKRGDKDVTVGVYYNDEELVFSLIDFNQHPSYWPHLRNIASESSIIPDPLQVELTTTRPDGFVSEVGLIYVNDGRGSLINFISSGQYYEFVPYYRLDIPSYVLTNADRWSYSIEVTSTKHDAVDIMYRTPWRDTRTNENIFKDFDDIDLTSTKMQERHYKGAQQIITLVKRRVRTDTPVYGSFPYLGRHELFPISQRNGDTVVPSTGNPISVYEEALREEMDLQTRLASISNTVELREFIQYVASLDYLFVVSNTVEGNSVYGDNGVTSLRTINRYNSWEPYVSRNYITETSTELTHTTAITNLGYNSLNIIRSTDLDKAGHYSWVSSKYTLTADPNKWRNGTLLDALLFEPDESMFLDATAVLALFDGGAYNLNDIFDRYVFKILSIKAKAIQYIKGGNNPEARFGFVYASAKYFQGMVTTDRPYPVSTNTANYLTVVSGTFGLTATLNPLQITTNQLAFLQPRKYFVNGYSIRIYFQPYNSEEELTYSETLLLHDAMYVRAGNLYTAVANVTYPQNIQDITYIEPYYTKYVSNILSGEFLTIDDDILVVWKANRLYISQPGRFYYFLEENLFTFDERIVKVIYFRSILLVFTIQHLYAVYRQEYGTEKEKIVLWNKQRVLYNILVDDQYKDAIQIFNQMILFYSSDGQLYLIKPSTQIDNETRFTLQYLNKSANDYLANFDEYINERLEYYGVAERIGKEDVEISVQVSINYIKIYYTTAFLTSVLMFDVINNRFFLYDTQSFSNIYAKMFVDSGELLVNHEGGQLLFTFEQPAHHDQHLLRNFRIDPIHALIDTGNINMNNHLRKRFKDLRVTFKNIDTQELHYKVIHEVDNIVLDQAYERTMEVRTLDGRQTYVEQIVEKKAEILKNSLLFDFKHFMSNALLTHRTYILGVGKVLRLRLMFIADGKYKIQGHNIVFKERRI